MSSRILIVDDEDLIRKSLTSVLEDRGFTVRGAATGKDGLDAFVSWAPEIVILDMRLPDADGVDLLEEFRQRDPAVRVIMITAYGDVGEAVRAMKLGAVDFIRKPYELEEILHAVQKAAADLNRDRRLNLYEERNRATFSKQVIIGESAAMKRVWETVEKVAASDSTSVLLRGESGTGKELFAAAIHHLSARAHAPLVDINCSSFQEQLLENELFGHEKGAFTGATHRKRGLVELCEGGTLFLDEVGEMPVATQAKLLRFIDQKSFRRVGGAQDIGVDLRIVAATNASLEEEVEAGTFRRDLYYRLKVVSVSLPALRERGDDVLHLAEHFLRDFSRKFRKEFVRLSPEVTALFRRYEWPGNVRELKNLLERVILLEDGTELEIEHLPEDIQALCPPSLVRPELTDAPETRGLSTLREAADQHLLHVLDACDGNRSRAARILEISRQHLINRLKELQPGDESTSPTVSSSSRD